jgi:hypothetical protein
MSTNNESNNENMNENEKNNNEELAKNENENKKEERRVEEYQKELDSMKYQLLREDYNLFDLSFKIIVIGNSGM